MQINQRKHIRFSLDIPATLVNKRGDRLDTVLEQISIGGCFTAWNDSIFAGDQFRLEIELPNQNRLPLSCKAIYRFEDTGIGITFTDISRFEQELIPSIITDRLAKEGMPGDIDPFDVPVVAVIDDPNVIAADPRRQRQALLDEVMSGQ